MKTKWIKTGTVHDFVFLGEDVIATTSGNHVIFFNLSTKEETIECFNSASRGDGASCLAGHPMIYVFSTAERCYRPKIFVHTYPEIEKVSECLLEKTPSSYLSCCFAGTDYLLSLTSFPNFEVIVWLWRSGQKLANIYSNLMDSIQIISASMTTSLLVYQFAPALGKLLLYEMYPHAKNITIMKRDVESIKIKIHCVCWTKNDNLILCDELQNVYIVSNDGKKAQLILQGNLNIGEESQILVLPFLLGFLTINEKSELTYYNKPLSENNSLEFLSSTWTVSCKSRPLKMTVTKNLESALLHCINGQVLMLHAVHGSKPEFEEIINDSAKFDIMQLLKPCDKHCVLSTKLSHSIVIINIKDGNISASYNLKDKDQVSDLVTHSSFPLIAVCTLSGKCIFLNASQGLLEVLKVIFLQRQPLDKIKFSLHGCVLGLVSVASNNLFLLSNVQSNAMDVLTDTRLESTIVDFLIYDTKDKINLITLVKSHPRCFVGNCVEIYSVEKLTKLVCKMYKIKMPNYYKYLKYGTENGLEFSAVPYLTTNLHVFKVQESFDTASLVDIVPFEHQLNNFDVYVSKHYVVSSGYDGLIIVKENSDLFKTLKTNMVQHYREKGVRCSVISVSTKMIVALGKNGSIVGLQLSDLNKELEIQLPKELENWKTITKKQINADSGTPDETITWLEKRIQDEYQKTKYKVVLVKCLILEDFQKLKAIITKVLDENERKSTECQLSISSFDLNKQLRQCKKEIVLRSQSKKQVCLQETIFKTDQMIEYVIKKFWNPVKIHDCNIVSFDSKVVVNNFFLFFKNLERVDDFSITFFNTPLRISFTKYNNDQFQNLTDLSFTKNITKDPLNKLNDYLCLLYDHDASFSGSTSFKWITNSTLRNQLLKIIPYSPQYNITENKEYHLKMYFNNEFERMRKLKKLVIQDINDSFCRLKYYKNELITLYNINLNSEKHKKIDCYSEESLENIKEITGEGNSMQTKPFMDKSYHGVSDMDKSVTKTKVEGLNEKLDFFKTKLDEMMDGDLEIRWEDEVKKEVPKPDCLLHKNPLMYDDEDRETLKAYKEKLLELEKLRTKYKEHLISEIERLDCKVESDINDFDENLKELALRKISIKSAILQEFLLQWRELKTMFLKNHKNRKTFFTSENELILCKKEHEILSQEMFTVETELAESKIKYENLNKRDKALEAKFKSEFGELKQPLVDYLSRQYKKRPKIAKITCASQMFLSETNQCLITGKKSSLLPQEYVDFLNGMDALDVMPNGLPPQIDNDLWKLLCKLRRNKVETEIKLRIAALELAEVEQTFYQFQKLISTNQSKLITIKNYIEEETLNQSRILQNKEVQIILKAAQIEVITSGHVKDFENAAIIPCKQLVQVNNDIIVRGKQKVRAMHALIALKKSILSNNWKYQFLRMKLKHLKQHLVILRSTRINKNIQKHLIEISSKRINSNEELSCEKIVKSVNKKFMRMQNDEELKLLKIIDEIKIWCNTNSKLKKNLEVISSTKQKQMITLEKNSSFKHNKEYHKKIMRSIMERTRLVKNIREFHQEIINLVAQLELLKLKTYPILH